MLVKTTVSTAHNKDDDMCERLLFDEENDILFAVGISEDDICDLDLANRLIAITDTFWHEEDGNSEYLYVDLVFTIPSILDAYINFFRNIKKNGLVIDNKQKPFFDKLKSELLSMIDKINSIEFIEDTDDKC